MFILNKGRYALAFTVTVKNREMRVELDKRRYYLDTGNLATTGITEVSDEILKELEKQRFFNECFEKGIFEEVDKPEINSGADELKVKDAEIARLKAELKEAKKSEKAPAKKELEAKDAEITDLKAKLEALTKGKQAESQDTEGF
jgi:hypothetical protein